MNELIATAVIVLAAISVFVSVLSVVVVVVLKKPLLQHPVIAWVNDHVIETLALISIAAFAGSNYYSEIVGYAPCKLCWWQRILFFPQAMLLTLALYTKDRGVLKYILMLSAFGVILAGYHYYGQMIRPSALPCDAKTVAEACGYIPFAVYGFVTVPFMAFIGFLANVVFATIGLLSRSR